MHFDIERLQAIRDRLNSDSQKPQNEEQTKQWLVMPLLVNLGYDQYSSDIVPEYSADVGTKQGEKVDYALQINNQPVMFIECKKYGQPLSETHVDQLFRYFATTSNVHLALLTNGDDYWFFTDSQETNIMDLDPFLKIRISIATDADLRKFANYTKDKIQDIDARKLVKDERVQIECKRFASQLKTNAIPDWVLRQIAILAGLGEEYPRVEIANTLHIELDTVFGRSTDRSESSQSKTRRNRLEGKEHRSNIQLNHEYKFNDFSDGNWEHHKLEYIKVYDTIYNCNFAQVMKNIIKYLLDNNIVDAKSLLDNKSTLKFVTDEERECFNKMEDYDLYLRANCGAKIVVEYIEQLCTIFNLEQDKFIFSFKD